MWKRNVGSTATTRQKRMIGLGRNCKAENQSSDYSHSCLTLFQRVNSVFLHNTTEPLD